MNKTKCLIVTALFAGIIDIGATLARAQSTISKEIAVPGSYCHMKFPAIREDTLSECNSRLYGFGRFDRFLRGVRSRSPGQRGSSDPDD